MIAAAVVQWWLHEFCVIFSRQITLILAEICAPVARNTGDDLYIFVFLAFVVRCFVCGFVRRKKHLQNDLLCIECGVKP